MENKNLVMILMLLILFFEKTVAQQYRSLDFTVEIPNTKTAFIYRTINLSALKVQDFVAISIVFESSQMHAGAVQCSAKIDENWQIIPPFGEDTPENRFVSELLYIPAEKATTIDFRFELEAGTQTPDLHGRIHVFIPVGNLSEPVAATGPDINAPKSILCTCPQPNFVHRSVWGAAFGLSGSIYVPPAVYTNVTHLIVHHSAGTNTSNNWAGVVAAIFDFHVNTNGWADIGYNWLIDPNGVLYEGRGGGDNVRGAHLCGYNNNTMGVCLLGNFVATPPSPPALKTLTQLFAWKCCKEDIVPTGNGIIASYPGNMKNISGHRDGCAPNYTECPGGLLYAQLNNLRLTVEENIQNGCSLPLDAASLPEVRAPLVITPNPATSEIRLQYSVPVIGQVALLNAQGQQKGLYSADGNATDISISVDHLPVGLYWLVHRADGRVITARFIKK